MSGEVDKLVTDVTFCKKVTITDTSYVTPTINDADIVCKLIEVKNRSGVTINVIPNKTDEFPLENKEDRVIMVKKLSDIQIARESGSGDVIVHVIIEN